MVIAILALSWKTHSTDFSLQILLFLPYPGSDWKQGLHSLNFIFNGWVNGTENDAFA